MSPTSVTRYRKPCLTRTEFFRTTPRLPAGATVAQALEVQRRKQAELEAIAFGIIVPRPRAEDLPKPVLIDGLIDRYLDQIQTLLRSPTPFANTMQS
jgi:hypothetical protein